VENGGGVPSGGSGLDGVVDVLPRGAGSVGVGIFEPIAAPADPAERFERANRAREPGGDGLLDGDVSTPAGGPWTASRAAADLRIAS
jgi:hypothetical protein